jgi:phosphonate transport system permease protein
MPSSDHALSAAGRGTPIEVPKLPPRPIRRASRLIWAVVGALFIGLLVYSWIDVGGSLSNLVSGIFGKRGLFRYVAGESLPPDWSQFWPGVKASATTFAVASLSITFGGLISVALLPLAARNIAPARWVYELVRLGMAMLRAVPELIMLLLFTFVFGISPYSAVIALTLHGIGVKGKLSAEAVEEMDMSAVDALRVAGASRMQVFLHAVLPGVRTNLLGLTLYRLDSNFRSAITLGAVGGGGIGFLIDNEVSVFQFKALTTYIIIIVLVVLAVERVSTVLRAQLT